MFAGVYVYGNFTGWGSEGVKTLTDVSFFPDSHQAGFPVSRTTAV